MTCILTPLGESHLALSPHEKYLSTYNIRGIMHPGDSSVEHTARTRASQHCQISQFIIRKVDNKSNRITSTFKYMFITSQNFEA